jgi:cathepsin L
MQVVVVLALLAAVAIAHPTFEEFKSQYSKVYESAADEHYRRMIYHNNVEYINQFNKEGHSYKLGVNEFADLLNVEFRQKYLSRKYDLTAALANAQPSQTNVEALPTSVDWRTKGVVTPVKNQGQCGSCWSFSTTGSLEGQHAIATGNLVSLSEQNLVDCSGPEGNDGCDGGLMTQAFEYVIKNNGIDTEASYPYTAVQGKCKFNPANVGSTCSGYYNITSGSEADLQNASATVGPISVAMDAGLMSFQLYHSGVYDPALCSSTSLDHGVLVVGYGVDGSQDYWLVKNSWGDTWGMEGYFYLARNANNKCGVATMASYPVVQAA